MITTFTNNTEKLKKQITSATLANLSKAELAELLGRLKALQAALYELAPLPEDNLLEVSEWYQVNLQTIRNDIKCVFSTLYTSEITQMQKWENEGGMIKHIGTYYDGSIY